MKPNAAAVDFPPVTNGLNFLQSTVEQSRRRAILRRPGRSGMSPVRHGFSPWHTL